MSKAVYSIVLSRHVVQSLDAMAAREGLSRSSAIDRILIEHLSLVTPESHLQEVLEEAERLLGHSSPQLSPALSDGLLVIRAPVRFRYNPTVRYAVELRPGPRETEGELRVSVRTVSDRLTEALDAFYRCFGEVSGFDPSALSFHSGRMVMGFTLPRDDYQAAAEQVAALLGLVHRAMHDYFTLYPDELHCRFAVRDACDEALGRGRQSKW